MKILISGATGKIGQSLVESLEIEHELILLSKESVPAKGNFFQVDLKDHARLSELIKDEKPEAIIHLAGLLAPDCEKNPQLAYEINVEATEILAKIAEENGVKVFIFASSSAVYNQTDLSPTNEFHNLEPQSIYGKTKLQAEQQLQSLATGHGTKIISLRLFNIYGTAFTDSLICKLLESRPDKPAKIYGPDNFYRDYIHISDVVKAFEEMLGVGGTNYEVYNIGSGKVLSNRELVEEIEKAGAKIYFDIRPNHETVSWADISRVTKATNWHPDFKLEEFVKESNHDTGRR